MIYEDAGTADLLLNFIQANVVKESKPELMNFPQYPISQNYIVDYPILAYKTMSPDDREIAIVHLAQNIPQRLVNLGEGFRFVCFVNCAGNH